MDRSHTLDAFADLSAALTGFDAAHLVGTGNADRYWDLLVERAGADNAGALLDAWTGTVATAPTPTARCGSPSSATDGSARSPET